MPKLRFRKHKKLTCVLALICLLIYAILSIHDHLTDTDEKNSDDSDVDTTSYIEMHIKYSMLKSHGQPSSRIKRVIEHGRPVSQLDQASYLILQSTPIFGEDKLCQKYAQLNTNMYVDECPYKNCAFTCDKAEFVNAHAILYHEWDLARGHSYLAGSGNAKK